MKSIKILGTGCKKCSDTYDLVNKVVAKLGVDAEVTKVEDLKSIMGYGVMSTPAVVIDDVVVVKGKIPKEKDVESWLK
ncbi:thioredoxin family protein [Fusibacter sp. JL216-2]|uniref:thioredoxin family protein n=1 Tax=Fusibacter sp. JL216-2 TaxID=3071453 RepID=UPI003D34AF4E